MAEHENDGLGIPEDSALDEALDTVGETVIDAVGATGRALQDAAARIVDFAGDIVDGASDVVDDVTEHGPLKAWGDHVGEAGRAAADHLEEKADEMEEDKNPASI